MEKPETYADGNAAVRLNRELVEITSRIDKLNEDWEDASADVAALNPKTEGT
jgi:hypothetical protein